MSYLLGIDESQWQGAGKNYTQLKAAGYVFTVPRMTYCYPGSTPKTDPTASANYYGAKAAGLITGGYHKVGWTDPIVEADAYINAMSPLEDGDIVAYDIEPNSDAPVPANWAEWEQRFVQRIVDRCHTYPWRYLNISMWNSMPAQGVVKNCTPWVAAPSYGWNDTVPVNVSVVVQQGPSIHAPGIPQNICDTDAFFGTTDQLLATTYRNTVSPTPEPTPQPEPTPVADPVLAEPPVADTPPVVTPEPIEVPPTPVPAPVVEPKSPPSTQPTLPNPQSPNTSPSLQVGWFQALVSFLISLFKRKDGRG